MTGTVRIISNNIYRQDAVGEFCYDLHGVCENNAIKSTLYAASKDQNSIVRAYDDLMCETRDEDILFYNHSIEDPYLPEIVKLPGSKLFYFHGITPPELLEKQHIELAQNCRMGLKQLQFIAYFDTLLVNSTSTKQQLLAALGRKTLDTNTLPPIIASRQFLDLMPRRANAAPGAIKRFLSVGRIAPHKKIEDTIALFSAFRQRYPGTAAQLDVVGGFLSESYAQNIKSLVQSLKLTDNVIFHGVIAQDELLARYQQADAFILMSEHEGFGVPLLEALKADVPVLAYQKNSVGEVLENAGCQFKHKNFDLMAATLYQLMTDLPYREQILTGQRQRLVQLLKACREEVFLNLLQPSTREG